MSQKSTTAFIIVLLLGTAAHVGYRASRTTAKPDLLSVSSLAVGHELPEYVFIPLDEQGGWEPAACQVLVVFNPGCAHCHTAAQTEAQYAGPQTLPIAWISIVQTGAAERFREYVSDASRVGYVADASRVFGLQATPAAFLVANGVIRDVWTYSGNENHAELAPKCA